MIVVDTNVIAYLLLGGDRAPEARATLQKDPAWAAPVLWRSEFRSVLGGFIRRNVLPLADACQVFAEAEEVLRGAEYCVRTAHVLRLVSGSKCSAYDCEFVALAMDLGVPLVTSDSLVVSEFPEFAVSLDAFAASGAAREDRSSGCGDGTG